MGLSGDLDRFAFIKGENAPAGFGFGINSPADSIMNGALESGNLSLVQRLYNNEFPAYKYYPACINYSAIFHVLNSPDPATMFRFLQGKFRDPSTLVNPDGREHVEAIRAGYTETLAICLEKVSAFDPAKLQKFLQEAVRAGQLPVVQFLAGLGADFGFLTNQDVRTTSDAVLDYLFAKLPGTFHPALLLEESLNVEPEPVFSFGGGNVLMPFTRGVIDWCCRTLLKLDKSKPCWRPPLPKDLPIGQAMVISHFLPFLVHSPGDKAALVAQLEREYEVLYPLLQFPRSPPDLFSGPPSTARGSLPTW